MVIMVQGANRQHILKTRSLLDLPDGQARLSGPNKGTVDLEPVMSKPYCLAAVRRSWKYDGWAYGNCQAISR